jgi:hypothetical protein
VPAVALVVEKTEEMAVSWLVTCSQQPLQSQFAFCPSRAKHSAAAVGALVASWEARGGSGAAAAAAAVAASTTAARLLLVVQHAATASLSAEEHKSESTPFKPLLRFHTLPSPCLPGPGCIARFCKACFLWILAEESVSFVSPPAHLSHAVTPGRQGCGMEGLGCNCQLWL